MKSQTTLLPTVTAVRMAWAMSGQFSDGSTGTNAKYVQEQLKTIEDEASKQVDPKDKEDHDRERSYVTSAAATIKSSMRSLETVYKGRELNFKENAILRESYLKTIEETQNFGTQTSDFLKGLPAMVVGGAGGVTLGEYLHLSPIQLWAVGLGLAAVGFGIKTIFVKKARTQTQHLYVAQDYERDCYYEQYVERVKDILMGLLLDLEHIHKKVFGEYYTSDDVDKATAEVECILLGVNPTFCKFVHKHMKENKITPDQWTQCECGIREITGICKHWEGPPITSQ